MLDSITRGCQSEKIYVSDGCYLTLAVEEHVKMLKEAQKYCNHSKKKQIIKNKIFFFENILTVR